MTWHLSDSSCGNPISHVNSYKSRTYTRLQKSTTDEIVLYLFLSILFNSRKILQSYAYVNLVKPVLS